MDGVFSDGIFLDRFHVGDVSGPVVVIDVLRAFTSAAYAFANGANQITLVGTVDDALALKRLHPDWILMGENGGHRIPGFDLSNSPVEVSQTDLAGACLIQRTTAGTQGVLACTGASRVFASGLVTASATARCLAGEDTHYVITGSWPGRGLAGNDDLWTAELIERARRGLPLEANATETSIRHSDEASWTLSLGAASVDPEDVEYALRTDLFDFAMEAVTDSGQWVLKCAKP